ncbi:MAG: hypothetical protein WCI10_01015 [Actinomycetota bacterium]
MAKRFILFFTITCTMLVSCGEAQETKALCSHAAELESSLVASNLAIESLTSTSPRQLQSTIAVLTGTLSIIDDVAPSTVKSDIEQTMRSYDELTVALQNVYWDGTVAQTDPNVQHAIANLSRNDNVDALSALRDFVSNQCKIEISKGINASPGEDQSATQTSIVVDPQPDLNYGFDNEETAIRSYAYFIAEQRGITITADQATCLGTHMINVAQDNPSLSDAVYESTLNASFIVCGIAIK